VDPVKRAASTDRELLERLGPGIQVRGFVETTGHPAIIINRKPFEVGDTLTLTQGSTKIEVKIKRITNEDFTITYQDAELTVRLPR
jgi:ribosomal 50S subunit-recycling heat shock protein